MAIAVDRSNLVFGLVASAGIAQFVGATCVAMRSYPSATNGGESGYRLAGHFLSDLGSSKTTDGLANADSALMFNRSVIGLGIALVPFFCVLASRCGRACWLVRGCGVLSALGLVGIGLTPYDQHFAAHHVALVLWLAPMLVVMAAYFTSAALQEEASLSLWIATALIVLVVTGYAVVGSRDGYIVLQKVLSVLSIGWFLLVFSSVSAVTWQTATTRKQLVDRQAEQFMGLLRHGYRKTWRP